MYIHACSGAVAEQHVGILLYSKCCRHGSLLDLFIQQNRKREREKIQEITFRNVLHVVSEYSSWKKISGAFRIHYFLRNEKPFFNLTRARRWRSCPSDSLVSATTGCKSAMKFAHVHDIRQFCPWRGIFKTKPGFPWNFPWTFMVLRGLNLCDGVWAVFSPVYLSHKINGAYFLNTFLLPRGLTLLILIMQSPAS